jgi:hypothetical protein
LHQSATWARHSANFTLKINARYRIENPRVTGSIPVLGTI